MDKVSAYTMEPCDLLYIDKKKSMEIIGEGLADEVFVGMLDFLWNIDLFSRIERTHLLPLVSNMIVKKYRFGQYIQKEGEEPKGLMIIKSGQAVVCRENLEFRKVEKRHLKNNIDE